MPTDHGPSPAESARTVLTCAAVLAVDLSGRATEDVGVHAVTSDGALVLRVPVVGALGRRAACGPAVATVHATRLLPLPVPERVLSRVLIHGTLGPAAHVSHIGERPIAITWGLRHAMPTAFFKRAALAAS